MEIERATSLQQIMGVINFSFEQKGEKQISNNKKYVTVSYANTSKIRPLISYENNGSVVQIIFLMPIKEAENTIKNLIKKFGTTTDEKGETIVKKENLKYSYREQNEVGMIIMYE